MVVKRNTKHVTDSTGKAVEIMEIDVSTADELPAIDFFTGSIIGQGSIAWCINEGAFYGLNSDGEWVNQENGEPAIASATTVQSAPMRMLSAVKSEEVVEDEKSLRNTESDENRLLD